MGDKVKNYFTNEFQMSMFNIEHENAADFYLCSWQRNRSCLPSLLLRGLIFIGCVAILVASLVIMVPQMNFGMWIIFMTHWGLLMITATSGLAFAVSLVAFMKGHIDASLGLPWYVKLYWIFYNTTITIALFITIFYWSLLTGVDEDFSLDPVLDIFIHGINSVLMFALLVITRHPIRMLHFYFPLCFGIIYLLFSVIFFFAGGESPFGTRYIYPMLDWEKPGEAAIVTVVSAFFIIFIHVIVVALSVCRNALTKRYRNNGELNISGDTRYY